MIVGSGLIRTVSRISECIKVVGFSGIIGWCGHEDETNPDRGGGGVRGGRRIQIVMRQKFADISVYNRTLAGVDRIYSCL